MQLEAALKMMKRVKALWFYLRQEGGIGLINKLKAYRCRIWDWIQWKRMSVGFPADLRNYGMGRRC